MLYFWKAKGPRTSKVIFWTVKYTNTAYDKMTEIPNICYIFEQLVVQGCQKWYSGLSDTQIHKYKFTNTQIQYMTKWQKYSTCAIFLNSRWFKDVRNDNPKCSHLRYTVYFCMVSAGLFKLKCKGAGFLRQFLIKS